MKLFSRKALLLRHFNKYICQCRFSNFRFNNRGNILGGDGNCPDGGNVPEGYVRGKYQGKISYTRDSCKYDTEQYFILGYKRVIVKFSLLSNCVDTGFVIFLIFVIFAVVSVISAPYRR